MKKFKRLKKFFLLLVCMGIFSGSALTAYAATTVKLVGTEGGTVEATYAKGSKEKNGYSSVDKTKVNITYTPPASYESCSDVSVTHFGLATSITKPTTDASETQVYPGAGWTCNGHSSAGAAWLHYFAKATVPESLQKDAQINKTLTVTLEQYKKAAYVWGGPGLAEGEGVEDSKYGWVMTYKKLPEENEIKYLSTEDPNGPVLSASITPSGTTAVSSEGKTWGTSATITATAVDNQSRPAFIYLYYGSTRVGQMASNSDNAKSITGSQVVTSNGQYKVYAQDFVGNPSELEDRTTYVECVDLTPPTIQSYTIDSQTPAKSHILTVKAIDSDVGLAAQAYSWDNGATWTNSNTLTVTANATYTVRVRDALGNTSSKAITVNNIDTIPPVIGAVKAEPDGNTAQDDNGKTWGTKGRLTISATDQGLGLADKAYSWDGGKNWTTDKTLTVTENRSYVATVRDKADNRDSKTAVVDFIDLTEPTISAFAADSEEWATQHVLTVTAEDLQSGLHKEAYSFDDGKTWTSSHTLTVSENGTYRVIVRDRVGNGEGDFASLAAKKNTQEIIIKTIDSTPPVLKQSQTPMEWTNETVTLCVEAVDEGAGLADKAYSWDDGKTWTMNKNHVVEENGTYAVLVRDRVGNQARADYNVTNIDKLPPDVQISQNTDRWTNQDVVLTITAHDYESGLTEQPYFWVNSSGETLGATGENTIVVKKNDTYTITVYDTAGNQTVVTHQITNIDKEKPEVSIVRVSPKTSKKWITGKAVLQAVAKDSGSGLGDSPYSWDGGATWYASAKKTIKKGGTYTVTVVDKAGNSSTCKYQIEKEKLIKKPKKTETPKPPRIIPETPKTPEVPKTPQPIIKIKTTEAEAVPPAERSIVGLTKEPEKEKEISKEPEILELEEEPEPLSIDTELEESDSGIRMIGWKPFKWFERIVKSALKAMLVVCVLFVIFLFLRTVPVYCLQEADSYKLVGRAVLRKKKEGYYVKISKRLLLRGDTSKFKLCFAKGFVKRKENDAFILQLPEERIETVIKREIFFEYSE